MKNTAEDIIDSAGFNPKMFKKESDSELNVFVTNVLSEQSDLLISRIGATNYDSTDLAVYVKRAEKCLTIAELIQRRINIILGNVIGTGREIDVTHEGAQKRVYKEEAEGLIAKIVSGSSQESSSDISTDIVVNSHFDTITISGAES